VRRQQELELDERGDRAREPHDVVDGVRCDADVQVSQARIAQEEDNDDADLGQPYEHDHTPHDPPPHVHHDHPPHVHDDHPPRDHDDLEYDSACGLRASDPSHARR